MHSNCYNYINLDHNKYPKDVMVHDFKNFLIIISCLLFTYIQKIERVNHVDSGFFMWFIFKNWCCFFKLNFNDVNIRTNLSFKFLAKHFKIGQTHNDLDMVWYFDFSRLALV